MNKEHVFDEFSIAKCENNVLHCLSTGVSVKQICAESKAAD